MPGPWERYQQERGPWDKYAQQRAERPNLKQQNPAEYDSASPEFQARYGARPPNPGVAVPEALASIGSSLIATPAAGLFGIGAGIGNAIGLTDTPAADVVERVGSALTYQPRSDEGRALSDTVAYPFKKLSQGADVAGDVLRRTPMLPSPYIQPEYAGTGAGPEAATVANLLGQSVPALAAGGIARGASNIRGRVGAAKGETPPAAANAARSPRLEGVPPTIEELGQQAAAAYKRASDAGVSITPNSLTKLKASVVNNKEIKGRINDKLHPQASEAIRQITETKGPLSLDQLENLRRIANDARGAGKADGRLAGIIVDEIDDYMARLGNHDITSGNVGGIAALKEARSLYSRKAKAEEIHRLIERAEIGKSKFSQSGFENALRNEFRALARNDKKMRRFTPEERAAIVRVANGGPMENAARFLGKFFPNSVVSSLPSMVSTMALGPAGMVVPIAGTAGRYAATRMTKANALRAEEVMRRGPAQRPPRRRNALTDPLFRATEKVE